MEETANTLVYFIAGYGVIFGLMGFYLVSLIVRWNNLKKDQQFLSELKPKDE